MDTHAGTDNDHIVLFYNFSLFIKEMRTIPIDSNVIL